MKRRREQAELVLVHQIDNDKSNNDDLDGAKSSAPPPASPPSQVKKKPPPSWVKKKCDKQCNRFGRPRGQGNSPNPIFYNKFGHFISPDQEIHPVLPAQDGRSGRQKYNRGWVHRNSILLDSAASIPLIFNDNFLDKISQLKRSKLINLGGGQFPAKHHGSLTEALQHLPLPKEGYFFHPDAVANILSMAKVSDHHRITTDTDIDNTIYVFNDDGSYICFHQMKQDVYEMQIRDGAKMAECHALTTVKETEMQYSALDRKCAEAVRSLKERLGFPSDIDLANAIDYNIVGNCQLNQRDIQIANKIFGPSVAAIKGKSTRRQNKMK